MQAFFYVYKKFTCDTFDMALHSILFTLKSLIAFWGSICYNIVKSIKSFINILWVIYMETFIYIVLCLLSLIGAATLIRAVAFLIFNHGLSSKSVTVIFLDNDSFEMTIRSALEESKWKRTSPKRIIAVDNGLSQTKKYEAKLLLADYNITLCKKENIFEELRDNLKK